MQRTAATAAAAWWGACARPAPAVVQASASWPRRFTSSPARREQQQDGPAAYPAWTPESRRTGAIAVKLGMTATWDADGKRVPVTVLQILENHVLQVLTREKDRVSALQIGAKDELYDRRMKGTVLGHCKKAGVCGKRKIVQFKVTEDAVLPAGTPITASHFVEGQFIDVRGTTIGKGFQGVMKKHGMKGQPASHGQTKTHRKMGASGGGQDPGRVWPGKRMAGRMGNVTAVHLNLRVYKVDPRWNVIHVEGSVPGHKNAFLSVMDAKRKPFAEPPPFPTHFAEGDTEKESAAV